MLTECIIIQLYDNEDNSIVVFRKNTLCFPLIRHYLRLIIPSLTDLLVVDNSCCAWQNRILSSLVKQNDSLPVFPYRKLRYRGLSGAYHLIGIAHARQSWEIKFRFGSENAWPIRITCLGNEDGDRSTKIITNVYK